MLNNDFSISNNAVQPEGDDQLLRASDVARRLAISRTQAYRLMQDGEIEVVRMRKCVRVRRCDLEQFILASLEPKK